MTTNAKLRIALYGANGHQLQHLLATPQARVEVIAVCGINAPAGAGISPREYGSLDAVLTDDAVDLVSLCSPRRADQAEEAIRCLRAGKHVLAEKPAALSEAQLDEILRVAEATGRCFREMGGTVFDQPYLAMRECVQRGELGEIVQVFAQKSYPYYPGRPQNEAVDGGLFLQCGIHAARMIEHVSGKKIVSLCRTETGLGNPVQGGLRMAAAFQGQLENGAIASAIANYLNPPGTGRWGNETLRVFGTRGMVEATDGGTRTRLVVGEEDRGALPTAVSTDSYFSLLAAHLLDGIPMPLSLEEELHPLRALLRAESFETPRP